MDNNFCRPVAIVHDFLMNAVQNVSFGGHSYWIKDLLGKYVVACSTLEMAKHVRDKINSSEGYIDLTATRTEFLLRATKADKFIDEEIVANEPEDLAQDEDFGEIVEKSKFHSKKKKRKGK